MLPPTTTPPSWSAFPDHRHPAQAGTHARPGARFACDRRATPLVAGNASDRARHRPHHCCAVYWVPAFAGMTVGQRWRHTPAERWWHTPTMARTANVIPAPRAPREQAGTHARPGMPFACDRRATPLVAGNARDRARHRPHHCCAVYWVPAFAGMTLGERLRHTPAERWWHTPTMARTANVIPAPRAPVRAAEGTGRDPCTSRRALRLRSARDASGRRPPRRIAQDIAPTIAVPCTGSRPSPG